MKKELGISTIVLIVGCGYVLSEVLYPATIEFTEFLLIIILLVRIWAEQWEKKKKYSIVPITYSTYNQLVDELNNLSEDGYKIGECIKTYHNSPYEGMTTKDFICYKEKL